jgi:hypothetical protein
LCERGNRYRSTMGDFEYVEFDVTTKAVIGAEVLIALEQ